MTFTEEVFNAVQNDPGGTAEAVRERHGNTRTHTAWARALERLARNYRIEGCWHHLYPGENASVRVYRKKSEQPVRT